MTTTREVLDRHLAAFLAHDVDGILADYREDVVFFTPDGERKGVAEVRPLFEALVAEFSRPGARFALTQYHVEGPHGYIVWNAETAENVYELGTDTFVVHDGRIVAQSYTSRIRPKH
jgi:ketosteroid isomerase-like protein